MESVQNLIAASKLKIEFFYNFDDLKRNYLKRHFLGHVLLGLMASLHANSSTSISG